MTDRRSPDRLDDAELEVEVLPNAAGGVIVKVSHPRYRRFATATHTDAEAAKRQASRDLARIIARVKYRRKKGMST